MVAATGIDQTAKARSTSQAFVFNASSNLLTASQLDLTASASANDSVLYLSGAPTGSSGTNGLFGIGTLNFSDTDIIANFKHSVNSYAQLVVQNTNSGTTASTDIVVNNDRTAGTTYFGDFGINGTTFAGGGAFGDVDGTYLYSSGGTLSVGSFGAFDLKFATNNTVRITVNSSGNATFTGQITSTLANSTTTGGGQIYLNGATGNRIDFNNNGAASPAFTTRSVGTKIVLNSGISAVSADYALGIESSTLWYSVPSTNQQHKWYAGTTNIATLSGAGALSVNSSIAAATNSTFQVGVAYLSSGGDYAHLATHEWYNGSAWQTDASVGAMFQITGQYFNWYKHNGSGTHTLLLNLDSSGNLAATGTVSGTNITTGGNVTGNAANVTGTVAVANGGTGATTRIAASSSIANFGNLQGHGTFTDANAVQQWGGTYIQGSTNTPNFNGATQHYNMMLSLGSDYDWGTGNVYAAQIAFARNVTTPYIGIRFKEGGTNLLNWGSWQKISAGYADSATYLNASNYILRRVGSGNYNTDFQNTPAGSMSHQGDDATSTNNPGGTWWFLDNYRHSNGTSYWGTQVAWGWEDNANRLATRNIQNNTFGSWVYYLNSSNYSTYASPLAGSASLTTTGTVTSGTWSASFGAVSGANLTSLNASNLGSGTVPVLRLGASGTRDATTYLRGDNTWQTVSGGATLNNSPSGTLYPTMSSATSGTYSTAYVSSTALTFTTSTGTLSATVFTSLSDASKKKNIRPIENAIEITKKLEGVRFDWKDTDAPSIGVIAQEVEKVLPELVAENDGVKSVSYGNIVGVLIEAIKEQQVRIEELERKLDA
jgi:hypothetical protein